MTALLNILPLKQDQRKIDACLDEVDEVKIEQREVSIAFTANNARE